MAADPFDQMRAHARDPGCGFSLGIFGAIAEFMRDPDEPVDMGETGDALSLVTPRGGLLVRRHAEARLVDYETPSRHPGRRVFARALCLPLAAAALAGRGVLAEIGPDRDALRAADREAILFDLGIGLSTTEACIRTDAPELVALLRAGEGRWPFEVPGLMPALVAHGPHRVFVSALGRIEVFSPIPPPDGASPEGPHTHVLPKLLAHRRLHAATVPIPEGLAPCLGVHPAGPEEGDRCTP